MTIDTATQSQSTRNAYQRFTQRLTNQVRDRVWIDDPSFALGRDEDIYAKIRRDPVFAHVIDYRRRMAAGREWAVEPASEDPLDRQLASVLEALLRELPGFTGSRYALAEAIFRGSAYAYVEGERRMLRVAGLPELSWWVPTRLVDVDRRRFRLYRADHDRPATWQLWSLERREWQDLSPEQAAWFVRVTFEHVEETLGYGRGALDTLYYYAMAKTELMDHALRAAERFGEGTVVAKVNRLAEQVVGAAQSSATRATAFGRELRKQRADGIFVIDSEDEVNALSGIGEGWELLHRLIEYVDARVVTFVLGANLPTSATAGGSYALADIQQDSTEAISQFDREVMDEHLTGGLLGLILRLNRAPIAAAGLHSARPGKFATARERQAEDPEALARAVTALMAAGLDFRKDELYRRSGFTAPPGAGRGFLRGGSVALPGAAPAAAPPPPPAPLPA